MKVELISYDSRYIIQYQSVDYLKVVKKQAVCSQLAFYFEGSNDRIVLAILTWGDEIGGVQAQAVGLVGPD